MKMTSFCIRSVARSWLLLIWAGGRARISRPLLINFWDKFHRCLTKMHVYSTVEITTRHSNVYYTRSLSLTSDSLTSHEYFFFFIFLAKNSHQLTCIFTGNKKILCHLCTIRCFPFSQPQFQCEFSRML